MILVMKFLLKSQKGHMDIAQLKFHSLKKPEILPVSTFHSPLTKTKTTINNSKKATISMIISMQLSIPSISTRMILSAAASTTSSVAFTSAPTASTNTQSLSSSAVFNPSAVSSTPSTSVSTLGTGTHCVNVTSKYLVQYVPVATRNDKS